MNELDDIVAVQNQAAAAYNKEKGIEVTPEIKQETATPGQEEKPKEEIKESVKEEIKEESFFEKLNSKYNKSFKSDDEINDVFNKAEKYTSNFQTYEAQQKEYEEELSRLRELTDPIKQWGSKENYKNFKISQKYINEGKDAGVVNLLLSKDFEKLNKEDYVTLDYMFNDPSLEDDEASLLVLENIGCPLNGNPTQEEITEAFKNLDTLQKAKLKTIAEQSKNKLKALKEVDIPDAEDYFKKAEDRLNSNKEKKLARENTLKEAWRNEYDNLRMATEVIEITEKLEDGTEDVYKFSVDKETLAKLPKIAEEYILKNDLDYTKENIDKVKNAFLEAYEKDNRRKIFASGRKDVRMKLTEKFLKERENPTPFSTTQNNTGGLTREEIVQSQKRAIDML